MPKNQSRTIDISFFAYLSVLALFIVHAIFLSVIAEDAHITFRFANNWATGKGLLWNVGEAPVEGYTNFLWVAISAGIIKLGLDLFPATIAVGVLSALGTIEFTRRFARHFLGCGPIIALVPCLLLAASGPLAAWAGSGLETVTFGLTILAACYFFVAYWDSNSRIQLMLAFLLAFLATLLRPEGVIIFSLFIGMGGVLAAGRFKRVFVDFFISAPAYLVPFLIYFFWRFNYFDSLLPNTYYAKTGGGVDQVLRGGQYVTYFSIYYLLPLVLPVLVVAWERGVPDWRGLNTIRSLQELALRYVGAFVCLVVVLVYTAYIVAVGGDYMAMYRFMVPVIPFIYLLLASALQYLAPPIQDSTRKILLTALTVSVCIVATVFHSTPLESSLFAKPSRQHGHFRGIVTEKWHVDRLTLIGRFFNTYKTNSSESLATRAIGAIGYYADMEVHDLAGLTDPYIARQEARGLGKGWAGHEKMDLDYSFRRLPTYMMFSRDLVPNLTSVPGPDAEPADLAAFIEINHPRRGMRFAQWIRENPDFISQHYELNSVRLIDEPNNEEGFFSFLELKGRPRID